MDNEIVDVNEYEEHPTRWEFLNATIPGLHAYIELQVGHKIYWTDVEANTLEEIFEEEYLDALEASAKALQSDNTEYLRAQGAV